MTGTVRDSEAAIRVAREFADDECVGSFGDVVDAREESDSWVVEFRTHTLDEAYDHRVQISDVGNVFAHEREERSG